MFLQSSEACSLPNSETPMSQQAIDDQNAFIANVGTVFDDGDNALDALIQTLGGNPAGDTSSGAAGVPTTGTLDTYIAGIPVVPTAPGTPPYPMFPTIGAPASWAWSPSPPEPWAWAEAPGAPLIVPGGGAGFRAPQGEQWNANRRRYKNQQFSPRGGSNSATMNVPANCPVVVPLTTTIPIPAGQPMAAPPPPPAPAPPPPPAPAPVTIQVPQLADCRTGDWCLDIMRGCVLSSQVSPAQLQACSEAGYAGNENLFPAIAAAGGAGGGAYFGTPEPNPAPYGGSGRPVGVPAPVPINYPGFGPMGVSGLGQDPAAQAANASIVSNAFEYVIAGLVTVAAMAILSKSRKSR